MADTSFTDMGKELDAAEAQYRDSSAGVSPDSTEPTGGQVDDSEGSTPSDSGSTESSGGDATEPKTDDTPHGTGEDRGKPSHSNEYLEGRRLHNHGNAALRLANKRAKEQREYYEKRQRLEAERKAYADEQGQYHNPQMATVKEDQIRELEIENAKRMQQQFYEESLSTFGNEQDAQRFVDDCKTYADWINRNESQLREYVAKPYGKLLLRGWIDRIARNPQAADWWQDLTPFEKYKTLDKYYGELTAYINKARTGQLEQPQQVQQTKQVNAPVPGSGRQTNNMPPTDNFSLELERAMQQNGVSRLVR